MLAWAAAVTGRWTWRLLRRVPRLAWLVLGLLLCFPAARVVQDDLHLIRRGFWPWMLTGSAAWTVILILLLWVIWQQKAAREAAREIALEEARQAWREQGGEVIDGGQVGHRCDERYEANVTRLAQAEAEIARLGADRDRLEEKLDALLIGVRRRYLADGIPVPHALTSMAADADGTGPLPRLHLVTDDTA